MAGWFSHPLSLCNHPALSAHCLPPSVNPFSPPLLPYWEEPCSSHLDIPNPEAVWKEGKRTVCPNLEATGESQEEEVRQPVGAGDTAKGVIVGLFP